MPSLVLHVAGPADRLLLAGLAHLQPVIDELAGGTLLIGGIATTAWLQASATELPIRATRDVDLGIDRTVLGLTARTRRIRPLLERHGFRRRPQDERFRFVCDTEAGAFLLDLLLPKGASRADPPLIEDGLDTVAAPGLAYALTRGSQRLELTLVDDGSSHRFVLPIASLDGLLVMKATLVADGTRTGPHRRVVDTADAVMLAAAATGDASCLRELKRHRTRSEPRRALRWLRDSCTDARSAAPRRVERHLLDEYGQAGGAAWAVATVTAFLTAFDASC
jgi:hypothetical protein